MQFGRNEKQHQFKILRKITSLYETCIFSVFYSIKSFFVCPANTLFSIIITMHLCVGISFLMYRKETFLEL